MTTPPSEPWTGCQVCGHTDHNFRSHLDEVAAPEFVHASVERLRQLATAGTDVHPLMTETSQLVDNEEGGRKAWAIWLLTLLHELDDARDMPEVAAEIENYLLGSF